MKTKKEFFKDVVSAYYSTKAYKEMKYPEQFEIYEIERGFKSRKCFKLVQEYKNYARYVNMKSGIFECFSKIDFKDNTNIKILI